MIFLNEVSRTSVDSPLAQNWLLMADPRLDVGSVSVPALVAVDDLGEKLESAAENRWARNHLSPLNFRCSEPTTRLAKTLTSLKGELKISVVGASEEVIIKFDWTNLDIPIR